MLNLTLIQVFMRSLTRDGGVAVKGQVHAFACTVTNVFEAPKSILVQFASEQGDMCDGDV